jgi:hypothetical protein
LDLLLRVLVLVLVGRESFEGVRFVSAGFFAVAGVEADSPHKQMPMTAPGERDWPALRLAESD